MKIKKLIHYLIILIAEPYTRELNLVDNMKNVVIGDKHLKNLNNLELNLNLKTICHFLDEKSEYILFAVIALYHLSLLTVVTQISQNVIISLMVLYN